MRPSGRAADALRAVSLTPGFARHAEGSCLIRMGNTEVLCAASVEGARAAVPAQLRARAGLPRSTACCRAPPTRAATARRRAASSPAARRKSSG